MPKITLDVTKLKVETFAAGGDGAKALMDCTERFDCTTPCILPTCEEYAC